MKATQEILDAIEQKLGIGHKAWDTIDPLEIIEACWQVMPPNGGTLILQERQRQIIVEGYTTNQDCLYKSNELIRAAESYLCAAEYGPGLSQGYYEWPWKIDTFKPRGGKERCLVKAGALIAAELDRIAAEK